MKDMKMLIMLLMVLVGTCSWSCQDEKVEDPVITAPKQVAKTNATKVYMHVMPWFQSKAHSGYWGSHWRMNNKNPENILPNGQREIASHYYPLIGPYDSGDPDLVDYHVLLMKYAGVDGVLIDWYGSHAVLDYGSNLKNTNAIVEGIKKTGLGFAMVYEDNTAYEVERRKTITSIEAAQQDMTYAQQHYFSSPNYIKVLDRPLWMTFGPRYFLVPSQWTEIMSVLPEPTSFFALWHHKHRIGTANATGEFAWVDFESDLSELEEFYTSTNTGVKMGSAYPGFHDYYAQGGWGESYGKVDHQDGLVFQQTLEKASAHQMPFIQLVTWNDFGEGTMIEPTVEFQYKYLEQLQAFTGVPYNKGVFETIHTYYLKRKQYEGDAAAQLTLDQVFDALNQLDVTIAEDLLLQL